MSLTDQVFAQACLLAGDMERREQELLRLLSAAAASSLQARLRPGLTPEDCRADFVAAASLFALSSMSELAETPAGSQPSGRGIHVTVCVFWTGVPGTAGRRFAESWTAAVSGAQNGTDL